MPGIRLDAKAEQNLEALRAHWGVSTKAAVMREALARCALDAEFGELGYAATKAAAASRAAAEVARDAQRLADEYIDAA